MKISNATTVQRVVPFVDDGKLRIEGHHSKGKITKFVAEYKGKAVSATVKDFKVLEAWKKVEKFLSVIK